MVKEGRDVILELTLIESTDELIYEGKKVGQADVSSCNSGSDRRF